MATYAAFRHVELDKVGYGKKRVLKPPGGGSSDIFGATETDAPTPRRVKNHQQSSVFGALASEEANGTPVQARNNSGGNPVTGEGYNGTEEKEHSPQPLQPQQLPLRSRVPPGGYSSQLW